MKRFAMCAAAAAALVAAGCGSDEQKSSTPPQPQTSVVIEQTGGKKDAKLSAPASVKGGLATVSLKNSSQAPGGAQLVRVEGNHPTSEVLKAGNSWGEKGTPLPEWIRLQGGTGAAKPGETRTVTEVLTPGNYVVLNTDTGLHAEMKVTGSGSGSAPSAAAKVTAKEYSFTATGLKTGKQKVEFDNMGKQPHFMVAAPIAPGKTIDDVKKAFASHKGPPPIDEKAGVDTAVLDGGTKQVADLDFKKKGKYALLCFVSDRQGGPPHAAKGMISPAEVK